MGKLWNLGYILSFLFLVVCCNNNDDSSPATQILEAQTLTNVSYGAHPQQVFDLYLPKGRSAQSTKVIMLIHGGGWTEGDKADMNVMAAHFRTSYPNHTIANVNYVLADANQKAFPHQFLDIQKIIQKLTQEKDSYQIKPEFGLIGTSAGAHLAMMVDNLYDPQNQIKMVINIVGPTNFEDPFYQDQFPLEGAYWYLVDQSAYPEGTNFLHELSPINHIHSNRTSPTALFYGTNDPLVPASNGVDLQSKLTQNQIPNVLKIYEGGHGNDWNQNDYNEALTIIQQYLDTYLP